MTSYGYPDYPGMLTDAEWELIKEHLDWKRGNMGRPPKHDRRLMLDAILYVVRTGCPWRYLPKDFPPWKSVHTQKRTWDLSGKLEKIHNLLVIECRKKKSKNH